MALILKCETVSTEGYIRDALTAPYLPIGLVAGIFKLNNDTLEYLVPEFHKIETKVGSITLDNCKMVRSKYLVPYKKYSDAAKALEKLLKCITDSSPEKFDPVKAIKCLKGTVYSVGKTPSEGDKSGQLISLTGNTIDWGIMLPISIVAKVTKTVIPMWAVAAEFSGTAVLTMIGIGKDSPSIIEKGWDNGSKFKTMIPATKSLLVTLEGANHQIVRLQKMRFKDEETKYAAAIMLKWLKFITQEAGATVRGYVVAAKSCLSVTQHVINFFVDN